MFRKAVVMGLFSNINHNIINEFQKEATLSVFNAFSTPLFSNIYMF